MSGQTVSYTYDDDGNKISETAGSQVTMYTVDENNPTGYSQVLEERTGTPTNPPTASSPVTTSYAIGNGLIAQTTFFANASAHGMNGTAYFLTDGHGSTRELFLPDGSQEVYNYDAFGNLLSNSSQYASTSYLYSGEQFDSALGQYYWHFRPYDPATGRFVQADDPASAGEPGDLGNANLYVYAGADPVNLDDPTSNSSIATAIFGTRVHSYLARAFEGFTPVIAFTGGNPPARLPSGRPAIRPPFERWGNRQIRSIARWYSGRSKSILRPDFVEVNTAKSPRTGDIYELKPGSIKALANIPANIAAAVQLGLYPRILSSVVPSVSWGLGSTWISGITVWHPPFLMPGEALITFDLYSAAPGAIFYDVMDVSDAVDLAMVARAAGGVLALTQGTETGLLTTLEGIGKAMNAFEVGAPASESADTADAGSGVAGSIGLGTLEAVA